MEDATISETAGPLVKERFPSVVDTDDLIFEIGKQTTKVLNLEKLLTKLLGKTKVLEAQTLDFAKQQSESMGKAEVLSESNKLYEENNRKLDAEIVRLKEDFTRQLFLKDEEITELKQGLIQKDEEIERLKQKKKRAKKSK